MSTWWTQLGEWGAQTEEQMAAMPDPMAPGSFSMIVGVYAGLSLGTLSSEMAGVMRRQLEAEMAAGMGVAPESLEAQMRQLLATIKEQAR